MCGDDFRESHVESIAICIKVHGFVIETPSTSTALKPDEAIYIKHCSQLRWRTYCVE
jgi:hypothetical protein